MLETWTFYGNYYVMEMLQLAAVHPAYENYLNLESTAQFNVCRLSDLFEIFPQKMTEIKQDCCVFRTSNFIFNYKIGPCVLIICFGMP